MFTKKIAVWSVLASWLFVGGLGLSLGDVLTPAAVASAPAAGLSSATDGLDQLVAEKGKGKGKGKKKGKKKKKRGKKGKKKTSVTNVATV